MAEASAASAFGPPGVLHTGPSPTHRKASLSVGSRPTQAHIRQPAAGQSRAITRAAGPSATSRARANTEP